VSSLKGQLAEAKEKYGDVVTAGTERQDAEMRYVVVHYSPYEMTSSAVIHTEHR
jgi:hypothetical protein